MQITGNFLAQIFPLLIIIALAFLLMAAWAYWMMSRRGRQREGKSDEPAGLLDRLAGTPTTQPTGAPDAASTPVPAQPPGSNLVEIFRVLRDLEDGSLQVEIDGVRYRRLADIADAQVGRRFMANARALAHFAMLLKGPPPAAPPPEAAAAPAPSGPQPAPEPPPSLSRARSTRPAEPIPMRPLQSLRAQGQADQDQTPASMISVADEIEELLQYRLSIDPAYALRSIHVRPGLGGGVRIEVDGTFYGSVDEVPDRADREFIQTTIQEWNARN